MNRITAKGIETMDKIYEAIVSYTQKHLYPPSILNIKEMTNINSTSTIQTNLVRLEKEGLIELGNGNRCIKLIGYELIKKTNVSDLISNL